MGHVCCENEHYVGLEPSTYHYRFATAVARRRRARLRWFLLRTVIVRITFGYNVGRHFDMAAHLLSVVTELKEHHQWIKIASKRSNYFHPSGSTLICKLPYRFE